MAGMAGMFAIVTLVAHCAAADAAFVIASASPPLAVVMSPLCEAYFCAAAVTHAAS